MTDYMVISVNGNRNDTSPYPANGDLLAAMPLASYEGGSSTTTFSPTDEGETNYLVIDGTILLCPAMGSFFFLTACAVIRAGPISIGTTGETISAGLTPSARMLVFEPEPHERRWSLVDFRLGWQPTTASRQ